MPYKRSGPAQICPQCHGSFVAPDLRPQTYCSRACLDAARQADRPGRFWAKVDRSSECWLWTGPTYSNGYGLFTYAHGMRVLAHRYAYEAQRGPIPEGMLVCHTCDVRRCVRGDHLFLGTYADNNQDAARKGHTAAGERHWQSKLTDAETATIRERHAAGERGSVLASAFGVSRALVSLIVNHKIRRVRPTIRTEVP